MLDERDFARFEFEMSFVRFPYIVAALRWMLALVHIATKSLFIIILSINCKIPVFVISISTIYVAKVQSAKNVFYDKAKSIYLNDIVIMIS